MADTGYVFVPQSCANGSSCGLVLALHGCAQSSSAIGETFAYDAGINEWADSNNFVVLYPQAIASPGNLLGCWDWGAI
jgi:poly(3-hydroxybutyrate) depolymerase